MDTLTKKTLVYDLSTLAGGDIMIPGDFSKYYSVTISADWVDVNTTDVVIGLIERSDSTQAWKYVTGYTIETSPGSQDIQSGSFGSKQLGIRITKNTATAGVITVFITAKH